jgi:hypothetical protein
VIARVIEHLYRAHQRFITAQEIAASLLRDGEGRNLVHAAADQQQERQSLEWLASNMVAWFSQRITVDESDWAQSFERTKIDGLWAYKPQARDRKVESADSSSLGKGQEPTADERP